MKRDFSLSSVLVAAGLLAVGALPVLAQERPAPSGSGSGEHAVSRPSGGSSSSSSGGGSSSPSGGSSMGSGGGGGDHAISRGRGEGSGRRGREGGGGAVSRGASPRSVVLPSSPSASDPGDRSTPNPGTGAYARPRGDRPAIGRAVPRDISNIPDVGWRRDPYWAYGYYRYTRWSPFYYGPWIGYMYYDPYWWDYYYGYAPGYYGGGGGYYADPDADDDRDAGALKLKVKPRETQVYVDGYLTGIVDEFDGVMQKLKLTPGTHRIELRAEGYQPSIFEVLIVEGETVTYRGELKPKP